MRPPLQNFDHGPSTSARRRRERLTALHALVARLPTTHLRIKRFLPIGFFFGGFTYDSLTLTRIDRLSDNLILLGYLIALGALVAVESRIQRGQTMPAWIYFLPVITRVMGRWMFVLSAVVSLVHLGVVWLASHAPVAQTTSKQARATLVPAVSVILLVSILYSANWIPPVPLAMNSAGVYHHASRRGPRFVLRYDKPAWYKPWQKSSSPFRFVPGDTAFFFAAVFAPTGLRKRLVHRWEIHDADRGDWITTDRLAYDILGGRAQGYRGITYKRRLRPGRWRVSVETPEGLLLGRIAFKVTPRRDRPLRLQTIER